MMTDVKLEQPLNNCEPILVTEPDKTTLSRDVQPLKTESPMVRMLSGITTDIKSVRPLNTDFAIALTGFPSI
jgi:hypothetical protein